MRFYVGQQRTETEIKLKKEILLQCIKNIVGLVDQGPNRQSTRSKLESLQPFITKINNFQDLEKYEKELKSILSNFIRSQCEAIRGDKAEQYSNLNADSNIRNFIKTIWFDKELATIGKEGSELDSLSSLSSLVIQLSALVQVREQRAPRANISEFIASGNAKESTGIFGDWGRVFTTARHPVKDQDKLFIAEDFKLKLLQKLSLIKKNEADFPELHSQLFLELEQKIQNISIENYQQQYQIISEQLTKLEKIQKPIEEINSLLQDSALPEENQKELAELRQQIKISSLENIEQDLTYKLNKMSQYHQKIKELAKNSKVLEQRIEGVLLKVKGLNHDKLNARLAQLKNRIVAGEPLEAIESELNTFETNVQPISNFLELTKSINTENLSRLDNKELNQSKKTVANFILNKSSVNFKRYLKAKANLIDLHLREKISEINRNSEIPITNKIIFQKLLTNLKSELNSRVLLQEINPQDIDEIEKKIEYTFKIATELEQRLDSLKGGLKNFANLLEVSKFVIIGTLVEELAKENMTITSATLAQKVLTLKKEEFYAIFEEQLKFITEDPKIFRDLSPKEFDCTAEYSAIDKLITNSVEINDAFEAFKKAFQDPSSINESDFVDVKNQIKPEILKLLKKPPTNDELVSLLKDKAAYLNKAKEFYQIKGNFIEKLTNLNLKINHLNSESLQYHHFYSLHNNQYIYKQLKDNLPAYNTLASLEQLKAMDRQLNEAIESFEHNSSLVSQIVTASQTAPQQYPYDQIYNKYMPSYSPLKHLLFRLLYNQPIDDSLKDSFIRSKLLSQEDFEQSSSVILERLKFKIDASEKFEANKAQALSWHKEISARVDTIKGFLFQSSAARYDEKDFSHIPYELARIEFSGQVSIPVEYFKKLDVIEERLSFLNKKKIITRINKAGNDKIDQFKDDDSNLPFVSQSLLDLKTKAFEYIFNSSDSNLEQNLTEQLETLERQIAVRKKKNELIKRQESIEKKLSELTKLISSISIELPTHIIDGIEAVSINISLPLGEETEVAEREKILYSTELKQLMKELAVFHKFIKENPILEEHQDSYNKLIKNLINYVHQPDDCVKRTALYPKDSENYQDIIKSAHEQFKVIKEYVYQNAKQAAFEQLQKQSLTQLLEAIKPEIEKSSILGVGLKKSSEALNDLYNLLNDPLTDSLDEVLDIIKKHPYFKGDPQIAKFLKEEPALTPKQIGQTLQYILSPEHIAVKHKIDKLNNATYKRLNNTKANKVMKALNEVPLKDRVNLITNRDATEKQLEVRKALSSERSLINGLVSATNADGSFNEQKATTSFKDMKARLQKLKQPAEVQDDNTYSSSGMTSGK